MFFHVLGWLTVASEGLGAAGLLYYLIDVGRRPYSWQQKLPLPKAVQIASIDGDVFDVTGLY